MLGDASLDDSPGENFPFTLSTLLHLEELTFHAEVDFSTLLGSFGLWDGLPKICHPIPAIKHAVKTISSQTLKFLELDFNFTINTHALPPAEALLSTSWLNHLFLASSSTSGSLLTMGVYTEISLLTSYLTHLQSRQS